MNFNSNSMKIYEVKLCVSKENYSTKYKNQKMNNTKILNT